MKHTNLTTSNTNISMIEWHIKENGGKMPVLMPENAHYSPTFHNLKKELNEFELITSSNPWFKALKGEAPELSAIDPKINETIENEIENSVSTKDIFLGYITEKPVINYSIKEEKLVKEVLVPVPSEFKVIKNYAENQEENTTLSQAPEQVSFQYQSTSPLDHVANAYRFNNNYHNQNPLGNLERRINFGNYYIPNRRNRNNFYN